MESLTGTRATLTVARDYFPSRSWESIAARRPFEGATAGEVFANIARGTFTPLIACRPDCGAAVSQFVDRALSRDLGARLPDAGQVRAELLRLRQAGH